MIKKTGLGIVFVFMLVVVGFMVVVLCVPGVYANDYYLICLEKGETIRYSECNPAMSNYYCNSVILIFIVLIVHLLEVKEVIVLQG